MRMDIVGVCNLMWKAGSRKMKKKMTDGTLPDLPGKRKVEGDLYSIYVTHDTHGPLHFPLLSLSTQSFGKNMGVSFFHF